MARETTGSLYYRASMNSLSSINSTYDYNKMIQDEFKEVVHEEPTTTVLALDASDCYSSESVLKFYLRHIHKPGNMVHAIFVMEDYFNTLKGASSDEAVFKEGKDNRTSQVPDKALATVNANSAKNKKSRGCSGCCRKDRLLSMMIPNIGPSRGVLAGLDRDDRVRSHEMKLRVRALFRINGVSHAYHRLISNNPGSAIVKFAVDMKADLIMIGSSRHGNVRRKVMGSTSNKVVNGTCIPVIVVTSICDRKSCHHRGHEV